MKSMSTASGASCSQLSGAQKLCALSSEQRGQWIAAISDDEAEAILHAWEFWARPNQLEPAGDWVNWLVMAGRGFGKTRIGAEQVRKWVKEFPMVNLVGPTGAAVVYSSFALDTETGILYSPTGNPGPDFVGSYRPGDNLYTCSIVMLDARTGALRGYHQLVKNDFHDTDWQRAGSCSLFKRAGRWSRLPGRTETCMVLIATSRKCSTRSRSRG